MKKFNRLFLSLVVTSFVVFNSCGDDKKSGTKNFGSQTEATAAVNEMNNYGVFSQAIGGLDQAYSVVSGLTAALLKERRDIARAKGGEYTYDPATGWWTWTYTSSVSGYTYDYNYQYRLTPHDANGNATSSTDQMEYVYDFDLSGTSSSGGTSVTWDANYNLDMDVTGIVDYRAGTGNLVFDGAGDFGYLIESSSGGYEFSWDYNSSNDYNAINWAPNGNYPASGSLDFTVSRSVSPAQLEDSYPNFNVSGTITFDGTNIAVLELGGFTFHLNLDTGAITPA